MDAATLKLAKNYTNEQVVQKATNSPVEEISFDGGIYSVGNNVVNGQVTACVLKGNTWTNKAGVGDTSPQTIALESAKTYLLLKTDGGTVNVDGVDTAVPAKITGKTSTVLTWASGKIALYELSTTEAALDAAVLSQKYHYVSGTKSTVGAMRLKSVGKNLFDKSKATKGYYVHPNGRLIESGPWAASDFIPVEQAKNYFISNVKISATAGFAYYDKNKNYVAGESYNALGTLAELGTGDNLILKPVTNSNIAFIRFSIRTRAFSLDTVQFEKGNVPTPYESYVESVSYISLSDYLRSLLNGVKDEVNVTEGKKYQRIGNKTNVASGTAIDYADMATDGQFEAWGANGEHVVGTKGDTLEFDAVSLNYQLAEPIVTKLPAQAPLQVFENGTVYVEPLGDPSETTLPTVELTVPIAGGNKVGIATHNYAGAVIFMQEG